MALHFLEVPVGRRSPNTPAIVKHLVRFGRRLREHGIHCGTFPPFVEEARDSVAVRVGNRVINIHNDGQINASFRKVGSVYDPQASLAHRNRWHAIWLNMAADSRRRGWIKSARSDLNLAISERRLAAYD